MEGGLEEGAQRAWKNGIGLGVEWPDEDRRAESTCVHVCLRECIRGYVCVCLYGDIVPERSGLLM